MEAEKPLLIVLIKRATIFVATICAISVFFWIVGSETAFLDETQAMLLSIVRLSSLAVLVAACLGMLALLAMGFAGRFRIRVFGLLGYAAIGAVGVAAFALAQYVTLLARGLP